MYEYPLTEYRDDVINLSIKIIIASIISLFCALAMGLWIASYQYTFSKNILASIREIANGNYKKKVESNLFFIPYEFDQMVNEFNVMREKIEQLDHFKSNLIDTVSHEFRTPLTSIKGFSSTLLRKDVKFDDETQNRLLKIISTQSDRLSRMVEDLLVVPKLEGHVLKLNLQEVELEPLFEDLSQFFPNKEFSIKIKESIYVLVDSDRFEQIILNLFENANKYSNPKTSSIRVRAFKEDSFAHIIVSNCSNKIEQNKLDSLFDKFFRLDDALTRTTGGTGLGLYITKSLVELMNGKIWLESTNEQFKVHILLPLDDLEI
ncbi:MAG: HAMP domain-containing sensor histidine kinase [Candidatus Sericytochromatia bacterium]